MVRALEKSRGRDTTVKESMRGYDAWFKGDMIHREDGPAAEFPDSYRCWYINGLRHREDGPAMIYADGGKLWCLNGEEVTEHEHSRRIQSTKV